MAARSSVDTILRDLRDNWERFGESDPLWAALTDPHSKGGRWDTNAFLATGEAEINVVMQRLASKGIIVSKAGRALDFGCGVGRLTQALAARFREVHGVDIADSMIEAAKRLNPRSGRCVFHCDDSPDLARFEPRSFALVYSSLVLQHIASPAAERYVYSLLRLLEPGGVAVLQVPDRFDEGPIATRVGVTARQWARWVRSHVALRTRLASARSERTIGVDIGHAPRMEMHAIPEVEMRAIAHSVGVRLADVALTNSTEPDFNGRLHYLDRAPRRGWVSKQYVLVNLR